ncbi:SDR family oxidoreductase [Marinigracilibium pacificum]|uniref:SDR family oxidoreductase n=1 Tax=Marinigracilibium pacificum TaxID=2729599 RepID=A0A848IUP4_9BACT|nr:SDR family oxidoreductase [Marinigracilibium pacificum]NMM48057.1 SDR family oxidoreductase [Marinigracilibium pacificum]
MNQKKIVVTGGAGFIGSNLVEALLNDERVSKVLVIDNLSNGYYENIEPFEDHPKFEFQKEDIRDYDKMVSLTKGYDAISHQAALGSVPRSIENPMLSNEVNVDGTINILHAAVTNGIDRVILACSSSTYGDSKALPKVEDKIGKPLSPYAVTKYAVELYADVFQKAYGLNYIGFRYFNVFGPKQNPDNPYAAVIPIFCKAFIEGRQPNINGDGLTSRDFTFVDNAVQANILGLFTEKKEALNQIYNMACGEQASLNEMVEMLREITGKEIQATYGPERPGDVKHSKADISKIIDGLGYKPEVKFREGLERVFNWYIERFAE